MIWWVRNTERFVWLWITLILAFAVSVCVSISASAYLVGIPIGKVSSTVGLKSCTITTEINKSVIKKKK